MGSAIELSRREREVAMLVAEGLTNRQIADRLFIAERTAEGHVEQIRNKLGFTSRSQIAAWLGRSQQDASVQAQGFRPRGNLPAQFTTFVGRDRELRTLHDLVTSNRLVTVTGPGGTGKTRLALRLAEELQPDFKHGAWFCDLAPLVEPDLVADAIAQALELKAPTGDRLQAVREHLRDRSALLVLDNCEHVLTSVAATIRDLLTACPGVRILATSRSPLGVIGEAVCRLDPMPEEDALRLFKDRAEAAVPNFQLAVGNADVIAAICRHLDGVPLAIELVVPRLRVQSPQELAAALLDPAWQTRSNDRHGSLYAVADWSYRLMTPAQQSLFRRVGIFPSWFEAEDAAAVAPEPGTAIPVLLGSLAEQSMLVQERSATPSRYRLLDTLRAYALHRLKEAGELDTVRLDHAEHVVWLLERMWPAGDTSLRQTTSIVDDVRAALNTLLRERPWQAAWLNALMMPIWRSDGRALEGLAWSERTLTANPDPSRERCRSLFQHALTSALIGHSKEAANYLRQAVAIADAPGNEELRSRTLTVRANGCAVMGDFESGLRLSQEAIDDAEQRGDDYRLAEALNLTAMILLSLGRFREAADLACGLSISNPALIQDV